MPKEKVCGIYKITSPTKRIYIGQSRNINKRRADYKGLWNCSEQRKLYNSFLKYGFDKHKFEIINMCSIEELNDLEAYYIDLFQSNNRHNLNIREGGIGRHHSPETIALIKQKNTGRKMSAESRRKMSESKKGKAPWNKGLKGCQVAWNKGISPSQESIEKGRAKNIGRKDSDETRKKKSEAAKGVKKSKEHAAKVGLKNRGRIVSAETRAKQSLSHIGKKLSEEQKFKISQSLLKKNQNERKRRRCSDYSCPRHEYCLCSR